MSPNAIAKLAHMPATEAHKALRHQHTEYDRMCRRAEQLPDRPAKIKAYTQAVTQVHAQLAQIIKAHNLPEQLLAQNDKWRNNKLRNPLPESELDDPLAWRKARSLVVR